MPLLFRERRFNHGAVAQGGCAAASAFLARTSGLSAADKVAYTNLICGLVADGVWAKLDALYIYAAPDQTTALLNLLSSSNPASVLDSPGNLNFTAYRGYINPGPTTANNGYLQTFLDTGLTTNYTLNNAHMMGWSAFSSTTGDDHAMVRAYDNPGDQAIFPKQLTGGTAGTAIQDNGLLTTAGGNRQGIWIANRAGTSRQSWQNDVQILNTTTTALGGDGNPGTALHVGNTSYFQGLVWNDSFNITDTLAAMAIGGDVSGLHTQYYNRLRAFGNAVGVP